VSFKNPKLTPANDIYLDIAKGQVPGHSAVIQRGHSTSISTVGYADLSEGSTDLSYMSTAEPMDIASNSTADEAAGTGVRTLLVSGIDNDGWGVSETVTMSTDAVATTLEYKRVNSLVALTVGSAGWNVGDVTAVAATANSTQAKLGAAEGITQNSNYTIPAEHAGYLQRVEFNAAKLSGGGTPVVEFIGLFRSSTGASWITGFDKKLNTGIIDELDVDIPVPTRMTAGTDIRLRAISDTPNTEARSRMYIILVDDTPST
jgi:hypothetical protein